MKKLILAFIALACAFAISSCCGQGQGFGKQRDLDQEEQECRQKRKTFQQSETVEETPYRWDTPEKPLSPRAVEVQERQHRRW
jgi:predicted small secreted protein